MSTRRRSLMSALAGAAALAMVAAPAMAGTVYHASATAGVTAGPVINIPGTGGVYLIPNATIDARPTGGRPVADPGLARGGPLRPGR